MTFKLHVLIMSNLTLCNCGSTCVSMGHIPTPLNKFEQAGEMR